MGTILVNTLVSLVVAPDGPGGLDTATLVVLCGLVSGLVTLLVSAMDSRSKARQAEKLNDANIRTSDANVQKVQADILRVQAEASLQLELAKKAIIDNLQEEVAKAQKERDEARAEASACGQKVAGLVEEVAVLRSRLGMHEAIIQANKLTTVPA